MTTPKFNKIQSTFNIELRNRITQYFKENQISPTGNTSDNSYTCIYYCIYPFDNIYTFFIDSIIRMYCFRVSDIIYWF